MSIISFSTWFHARRQPTHYPRVRQRSQPHNQNTIYPPGLPHVLYTLERQLPRFVRRSPAAMKYHQLLAPLAWEQVPWRQSGPRPGPQPASPLPYLAAFLVKLDQQLPTMGHLRRYLVEQPALTWLLGFPLQLSLAADHGFDVDASLPSPAHFSYVLRTLGNDILQFLLTDTVKLLRIALPDNIPFGQSISLDTKVVIAWVKENNPKAYIKQDRYSPERQPVGDPDCRVRCKRRRNVGPDEEITPTKDGQPAVSLGVGKGEYFWGYASGVAATKVPGWGEFVLAELTRTFNHSDISHFFPLLDLVEQRLGFRPPYGTMDAAYDAWYVYEYFHEAGGFAAVPLARRGNPNRQFDEAGLPLCPAGLAMPLKGTFINRTSLVVHQRGRYACPLLFPQPNGQSCPIDHDKWPDGGCLLTMPTSIGARIRLQLDRQSQPYKDLYKQRTAVERLFAQAVNLGIERPKLRNRRSITNLSTLIYTLINLRAYHRVCAQRANSVK